jgi:hypothetical protein
MISDRDRLRRGRLLYVVLTALQLRVPPSREPGVIPTLRRWLDSWTGIGLVVTGMARQGFDLQLTRYGEEGWRATFYTAGKEHSVTASVGSAWERTPWQAVQGAAWDTLRRTEVTR